MRFEIAFERGSSTHSTMYDVLDGWNEMKEWRVREVLLLFVQGKDMQSELSHWCAMMHFLFSILSWWLSISVQFLVSFYICLLFLTWFLFCCLIAALKNNWKEIESFMTNFFEENFPVFLCDFLLIPCSHCGVIPDMYRERK